MKTKNIKSEKIGKRDREGEREGEIIRKKIS